MRMGYGPDEIYTRSAQRSLKLWQALFAQILAGNQTSEPLFHQTGVLWMARDNDAYADATMTALRLCGIRFEVMNATVLASRYPQLEFGPVTRGMLEPDSGVLMARQAVRAVVNQVRALGATHLRASIREPEGKGNLEWITTVSGERIRAGQFVFACGPWLPKLFPEVLKDLINVTRQEVFFFGVPKGDSRFSPPELPVWIDFNDMAYAIPDVDGRGFKVAIDAHGPDFDPESGDRMLSESGLTAVRSYVSQRVPSLKDAPLLEGRVCQYENTSNGDFLIDLHPGFVNVWFAGGGSGHGFKHGPATGEYVARLISGKAEVEPRFTLGSKGRVRARMVY
jgi:glycine/D-amino acid oxidase-like deaminating enzyme